MSPESQWSTSAQQKSSRMMSWITRNVAALDDLLDTRWRSLRERLGLSGIPQIQAYIGYSNQEAVYLHGRVLTNPPEELPDKDDQWWENIANMYQRFASNEVAGVTVEAECGDHVHRTVTDHEGYFSFIVPHNLDPAPTQRWSQIPLRLIDTRDADYSNVLCQVMHRPPTARFGIISDVDDTVVHTGATQILTMLKMTFLKNARTRVPLEGVAKFYQALHHGPGSESCQNPVFYVSSSPWNIFDVLEDFLVLHDLPLGPILLRDLGFDDNKFLKEGHEHKLQKTRRILNAFPELPFLLIGDSGQDDPVLYAQAASEFGDRILAIFIRDVDPEQDTRRDARVRSAIQRSEQAGVPMHLISDSESAARICRENHWIASQDLPPIVEQVERDRQNNRDFDQAVQSLM